MKTRSSLVSTAIFLAVLAGCSNEATEDYPDEDEVPVVETTPGGVSTDTMLSPVTTPTEPGATPP